MPLDAYLANGTNYETVRLIALSDRVLGRDSNYDVLFDSAVEAIRENPGTYARGVADVLWEFLMQRPLREGVAPRAQTAPEAAATDVRERRRRASEPAGDDPRSTASRTASSGARRTTSTRAPSRIRRIVWDDPAVQERYREVVSQVRAWDAELPSRTGEAWVTEILNRITPRFPRPPLWLAVGAVALVWRRPRGWRTIVVLWAAAAAVLLIHAASQGVAPEFALPLYPVFIVTALRRAGRGARPAGSPTGTSSRRRYHRPGEPRSEHARGANRRARHLERRVARAPAT